MNGLSIEQSGYRLDPIHAPTQIGYEGQLSFQLLGPDGKPVTEYAASHERDLHLIIVRADGAEFSHVHPNLDSSNGTWSLPWTWKKAGTYRVFIDVLPAGSGEDHALTLTRTVHVAGDFEPQTQEESATDTVDGFEAVVSGSLVVGEGSPLTISISRNGEAVTSLEPYLGAYGHLVALREGDLGYLHIHPGGQEPQPGETSGPEVSFTAHAPTPGKYLLYLDFQIDGKVHSAHFVLDAAPGDRRGSGHRHHGGH
jgi:hypothetical protein